MIEQRSPRAGGFPIAAGALLGAGIGFAAGEPTLGFFLGLSAGVAAALLIWRRTR